MSSSFTIPFESGQYDMNKMFNSSSPQHPLEAPSAPIKEEHGMSYNEPLYENTLSEFTSQNSQDEELDRLFELFMFPSHLSEGSTDSIGAPPTGSPGTERFAQPQPTVAGGVQYSFPPQPEKPKGFYSSRPQPPVRMKKFPTTELHDLKHIVYNLLVDYYNGDDDLVRPVERVIDGVTREGFQFDEEHCPEKRIPELYARYIRNSRLDLACPDSCIIQDLYKFYMRACLDLLAKYFEKVDKYTFLCDDISLFVAGENLDQAETRLRSMKSLARKRQGAPPSARGRRKRQRKTAA